ncbi:MAG: hypothetical protein N3A71_00045 [Candidatus Dojkabacteria bacterium]|nr:hypothetical protein [Candidatus Dojkabacteria bacterium]
MPINNNTFSQAYPQVPQMQQPLPPMPNNMSQQPLPNGGFNSMPNANFPNAPYPPQMSQQKSNKGCLIGGVIVGCITVILLCVGFFTFMFLYVWNVLPNAMKPMIKTFALFNDVCEIKFDEKGQKEFAEAFSKYRIEEKDIILYIKPREFYDTAFSDQLKSKYSYEQFTKDIQPLNTSKFCEEYKNKISSENIPVDGQSGGQIIWGPFGGYIVRTTINASDGLITEFKVERSEQKNNSNSDNKSNNNSDNSLRNK